MKEYIPFTQARRNRLFALGLQKQLGNHEVLLQIEYPDGQEQFKPASYNPDMNCWETDDGQRYYSKGYGGDPGSLMGVPVVHVDSINAGVVSKEASKVANREDNYDYVDSEGRPIEVVSTDDDGTPLEVTYADESDGEPIAADGGEIDLHYDLTAPEGYTGEVIDRRKAGLFDPFPVSRQEADQAIEHAQAAAADAGEQMKTLLVGIAVGAGLIIAMLIIMWLLGQIGDDGGGGSSVPMMISGLEVMIR